MIYNLIKNEVRVYTAGQFLVFMLFPIGILALLSQLGGIFVILGAALFAVIIGKFLAGHWNRTGIIWTLTDLIWKIT